MRTMLEFFMDQERRDEFTIAWQRWCNACEDEWRQHRVAREGRPAKTIQKTLEKELEALGLNERLVEDQLVDAWADAVGPSNAHNSRPVQLQKGVLIVAVAQPALKYDFERFHKAEILKRMQEKIGKNMIRDIRFRVGN